MTTDAFRAEVLNLVDELGEDANWETLHELVADIVGIEAGMAAGRVIPHDDVVKMFRMSSDRWSRMPAMRVDWSYEAVDCLKRIHSHMVGDNPVNAA